MRMNNIHTGYRDLNGVVDRLRSNQKRGPVESVQDSTGNYFEDGLTGLRGLPGLICYLNFTFERVEFNYLQ